jgi:hypothetical protein
MNHYTLTGGIVLLLAGCATHSSGPAHQVTSETLDGCVAEVHEIEGAGCFQVVRVSGDCSSPDAVYAEHAWLARHYPGWQMVSQALTSSVVGQPAAVEDHIRIRTADGQEVGFCFDITEFW